MNRVLACFLALAMLHAAVVPARAADPVTARATVDRTVITMGDRVELQLTIEVQPGYQVTDPGVKRVIGDFEIVEALPAEQTTRAGNVTRYVYRYLVTTFRLGDQTIAPVVVQYTDGKGSRGVTRTDGITIKVNSVIRAGEDTSDIKPLKPQLELFGGLPAWFGPVAVAVGALVVGLLVAALVRLLRLVLTRPDPEALLTPQQRAVRELHRIAELQLPEAGEVRAHYELLARCLRRYVLEEFGVSAPERTPRELRVEMVRAGVDRYQALMIDEMLIESEVVRFGHFVPSVARAHNAVRVAAEVIEQAMVEAEAQGQPAEERPRVRV